ncbi:hypothetical protein [Chelatococcus reniformis]|uniref:Uncharacterized protein n=1 Tax=Chelatococcus reniformis TaxID=1494448 RepID=A0A916XJT3_9HYPH|nr:hypothetical protein [Chelatococcus reniformis]GGC76571.1 hypothetical protein GCM10010994_38600 [Chelatococcus reniformis]
MNDSEKTVLFALALMANQYLRQNEDEAELDSLAMSAGEHALEVLAEHGLVELVGSHRIMGRWTEAGRKFLQRNRG